MVIGLTGALYRTHARRSVVVILLATGHFEAQQGAVPIRTDRGRMPWPLSTAMEFEFVCEREERNVGRRSYAVTRRTDG